MPLHIHKPLPPLSEFVDVIWYAEDYQPAHEKERILPDGRLAVIINLREDRLRVYESEVPSRFQTLRGMIVAGPRSEFHVIDTHCQQFIIGLHFKPGGAFRFLPMPVHELAGAFVGLDQLWGAEAVRLREQLLAAPRPKAKFNILNQALLGRLKSSPPGHPAVNFALRNFDRAPFERLAEVTARSGLSHRRFIEVFRAQVGLAPKAFCRVRRFQEVLRRVQTLAMNPRAHDCRRRQPFEWSEVALACGYYDQAHFIHEFQGFCGLNPTAYLKQRSEHLNHLPISD